MNNITRQRFESGIADENNSHNSVRLTKIFEGTDEAADLAFAEFEAIAIRAGFTNAYRTRNYTWAREADEAKDLFTLCTWESAHTNWQ
jgi:hypothetical protein